MDNSIVSKGDSIGIAKSNGNQIKIDGTEQVVNAVLQFAKFGLITFSRGQYFKSSYYSFCFFKPVEKLKLLYNLRDEVLLLCCYDALQNFKSRTKDFIDYLLASNNEFKNRLDKITCFLVDNCDNIEDIILEDRQSNPDTRLIVPFSYSEIGNNLSSDLLLHRMRTFLYERDLFGIASPLNDENFFFGKDRYNLISELYGKYRQGEPGGLFGLRRIGKTSVLNLLCKRVEQDNGIVIYFDCSKYHHQRWNSFLHQIIRDLIFKYQYSDNPSSICLPSSFSINEAGSRYTEQKAPISFEDDIHAIYTALGCKRILLIFDEIEQISYSTSPSSEWREENDALFFWQVVRGSAQRRPEMLSYIITGVNPNCTEIKKINGTDNPIFSSNTPQYISLFDYDDTRNMVSSIGGYLGLQFDQEVYAKLVDDYGGHPFLIRQVCSRINNSLLEKGTMRPYTVPKESYDIHATEYRSYMTGIIQQILGVLEDYYPSEYELLKTLALDGSLALKKKMKYGERDIDHLIGYCLIKKVENDYYIRIKSIEKYIQEKYLYDKTLTSPADKRTRISIRRNNIEEKLKELVATQYKLKWGKRAKQKLIEQLEGTTKDTNQAKRMQDKPSIDEAISEVYLIQLKILIEKDWKSYQEIFIDKTKFSNYLDIINEMRVDAHSKTIDEEDEAILNYAFKFFEKTIVTI